jgi:hypothetical protein
MMTLLVQNSYSPRATLTLFAQAAGGAMNADRRHNPPAQPRVTDNCAVNPSSRSTASIN